MQTKTLGKKIRKRRLELDIPQNEFGKAFQRSGSHVRQWETGDLRIPHELFDDMARILKVHPRFFYEEDYWPSVTPDGEMAEPVEVFSDAETASLSPADIVFFKKMRQVLHAVSPEDRPRLREMLTADATSIMANMITNKQH